MTEKRFTKQGTFCSQPNVYLSFLLSLSPCVVSPRLSLRTCFSIILLLPHRLSAKPIYSHTDVLPNSCSSFLLIPTHCFSFNTYRPLIQCWWWAHSVSMGCSFSTSCESGANALSLSTLYDGYIGRHTNRTMDTPTLWREYRQRPVVMAPQSMWHTPKNTKNTHKNRNFAQYLYKYC